MRSFSRHALAFLCAAAILLAGGGARAEFSPRYAALAAGKGMAIELSARFETMDPLSKQSLEVVNDWLSRLRLILSLQETPAHSLLRGEALLDGQELFSVISQRQQAYTLTAFSPSDNAYLTDPDAPDALSLLTEKNAALLNPVDLYRAYVSLAPALYPLLGGIVPPKVSRDSTSIKNASASASYENYTLNAEEMNAAWPDILALLLPALKEAWADQPQRYEQAAELLRALEFSGECRFKRFLDKEQGDMGLQFTGRAARGEDVRKVTLFGGYTPGRGGYLSLALPAVSGKNNFKITFTGKLTQKSESSTLTLEGSYTRSFNGESESASLEGDLKNTIKNGDETWSGKVTVQENRGGVKAVWTVSPKLLFDNDGLHGTIGLQKKSGSAVKLKGEVTVNARGLEDMLAPAVDSAKDLRGMERARARAVVMEEMTSFTRVMTRLMAGLPEEARLLLTHDLRTDAWMNGPTVPVLEEIPHPENTDENQWIVEEENQ